MPILYNSLLNPNHMFSKVLPCGLSLAVSGKYPLAYLGYNMRSITIRRKMSSRKSFEILLSFEYLPTLTFLKETEIVIIYPVAFLDKR